MGFLFSKTFQPSLLTCLKRGYKLNDFKGDLFAGITVAIIAFPLAMALAVASGSTPEKGLITVVIAGFIISALGGSRIQIGGPTGAFVIVVFTAIQNYGYEGLLIATIMAGIILVCAGFLKMGIIIKYIPQPVIIGFTSGIATVIFSTQIKDFFGLPISQLPADFIHQWETYFAHIKYFQPSTLLISLFSILAIITAKKFAPRFPVQLILIILAGLFVFAFEIPTPTIFTKFGNLSTNLPYFAFPSININLIITLLPTACTIAFLAGIESLLSAIVADSMIGDRHHTNTELIAQGTANIASALFGGLPATGALARTAVNAKSGANTPIAGIIHAVVVFILMLAFAKFVSYIPLACLSAILIIIAWNMSEIQEFRSILRSSWEDRLILIATFLLTILSDITVAISVGIIISSLIFIHKMSNLGEIKRKSKDNSPRDIPENVFILDIEGPFFFGSASRIRSALNFAIANNEVFILNMQNISFFDTSASHSLKLLIQEMKKHGGHVILSGPNDSVRHLLDVLHVHKIIPKEKIANSLVEAIEKAKLILQENQAIQK